MGSAGANIPSECHAMPPGLLSGMRKTQNDLTVTVLDKLQRRSYHGPSALALGPGLFFWEHGRRWEISW
jgi:hypothetical protein